jgi:hypothetical protein
MGDIEQVITWGPTNIRRHRKKFRRPGIMAPGVCSPLVFRIFKTYRRSNNLPTFVTKARRYFYIAPTSVVITKEDPEVVLYKSHIQLFRMTFKVLIFVKFFLCFSNWAPRREDVLEVGCIAACLRSTRWKRVVILTLGPLYFQGRSSSWPLQASWAPEPFW